MKPNHIPIHKTNASPIKDRVDDLVSRMTLEEKISQMVFNAPAIERLNIPKYNWWNEGLHGVGRAGLATVFPQAIGLAATWNPDLIFRVATAISDEARAKHHEAARRGIREIYSGLTFWSPNINIFRDPRWGRGQETYGEDPYLTAKLGVAFIKGLQGDDPQYWKLVATPKHYAVHSGPDLGRHGFDAKANEQDMLETYLPAFEACIKEARAASIMGAYNRTNGEPCCASPTLLQKILRTEWGFGGFVVSDCGAIRDIYAHHKVVGSLAEAAAISVKNGCDLNCGSVYMALIDAVDQGLITEREIDLSVNRLFTARFRLGMFDPSDHVPYAQVPYEVIDSVEHRSLALKAARESIVLLKNENNLLPLRKDIASIAVIGPNADDARVLLGNYNGTPEIAVTPLAGIRGKVSSSTEVNFAPGCGITTDRPPMQIIPSSYLRTSEDAAHEKGLRADYYANPDFEGTPGISQVNREINFTWKDTTPLTGQWGDNFSVRWDGFLVPPVSGTYLIGISGHNEYRLFLDGDLIAEHQNIHHAVLKSKDVKLEAGHAYKIQLEYVNRGLDPQVHLLWSIPGVDHKSVALEAVKKSDVAIVALGLSPLVEGEEMPVDLDGFAGGDRTDIKLPKVQEDLLKEIHALGKPVILVLLNGGALAVSWAAENIPAIIEAWYPGQAGGEAIAEVLFGDYNPAGKLPVTYYKSLDDLPPFEDYNMQNRTYRYFKEEALFPFGYGLSYTDFQFDNLHIDQPEVKMGGSVAISVAITNTGEREGDEVVQLYTRYLDAADQRPIKELKGFKRLALQPEECKTVTFSLHTSQLGTYNGAAQLTVQPGIIEIMVGNSSNHLPLRGRIELAGETYNPVEEKVFFSDVSID
ncbi:MAG: glycoside hydrolase family 3 C-terminal domain-containing protein [Anaerolineaceae bacterium]|nr:glycoside hydrolase family 3 C-terminal domain-containing protein [Anaerolineaceae bacterium]